MRVPHWPGSPCHRESALLRHSAALPYFCHSHCASAMAPVVAGGVWCFLSGWSSCVYCVSAYLCSFLSLATGTFPLICTLSDHLLDILTLIVFSCVTAVFGCSRLQLLVNIPFSFFASPSFVFLFSRSVVFLPPGFCLATIPIPLIPVHSSTAALLA